MSSQNQTERKLAVILFADIAGYTAMMQSDEGKTMNRLRHYQQILSEKTNEHRGEIVKNYGDGSMCLFSSVLGAVNCAKELQEIFLQEPKVPLRIGIHIGDVMYEANDIYGDSINVASRIESMGIPGSVLMSRDVYKKVKNQSSFEFKELGSYEFKNVEEPMLVYALANQGLAIPDIDNITGKFKSKTAEDELSYFQKIWKKKIPQILIAYIMLAWIGLQVFDWGLFQFGISPHWAQIFFITVLGIIPSLLVYLNNKERIQQSSFSLGEKVLFPSNFAIIGAVLYFVFNSADLGAISKKITFLNADGEEETHEIIKAEFKKEFKIFPFEPISTSDTSYNWFGWASSAIFQYTIKTDKYLSPGFMILPVERAESGNYYTKVEKINNSKVNNSNFYVDGQFKFKNDEFFIKPAIRNKITGEIIKSREIIATNIYSSIDSVISFIRQNSGLESYQLQESLILGFRETSSDNIESIKALCLGFLKQNFILLKKAVQLDSTYAGAAYNLAMYLHTYSMSNLESKIAIDKAIRHRTSLHTAEQIRVLLLKHMIYKEYKKAEQLLNIQLEIDPENEEYNLLLTNLFLKTFQIDKFITQVERHYEISPGFRLGTLFIRALLMKGEPETVINKLEPILEKDPQLLWALLYKAEAYIHMKEYDSAKEIINNLILINPEKQLILSKSLDAINYLGSQGNSTNALSRFSGKFRAQNNTMIFENRIISNNLYINPENQQGFFMYLAGENIVKRGYTNMAFQSEIQINDRGKVYALKQTEFRGSNNWSYYLWKQDSIIFKAENYLKQGDYESAYDAYKVAIAENPEHFYLTQHMQHLIYLRTHSEEEVQRNMQRVVGDYSNGKFWIENGLLYMEGPESSKRIFRPISDNRFIQLYAYAFDIEFVQEKDKVVGYRAYSHDFETNQWNLDPNQYYERTKFLD